ncbi:hypothetical protein EZJ49_10100 [Bdellovibrio bacteriovorus]|uniref:hypothetical protein n=1 Tax=Bdellovibrio bacteriovorus TaxID=959 RepID=UPI0021CF47C4|nr:hypothetical protein [Bdellovibrio bacteriovorus]UXR63426.1 hypothetical protein EZJ49_10100 [Bdellovibrio bacteriovorus]
MKKAFAVFALVFAAQSLSYAATCQPDVLKAAYDHYSYIYGQEALVSLNLADYVTEGDFVLYRVDITDLETSRVTESWVKAEVRSCKIVGIN